MHSYLITGGSEEKRLTKIQELCRLWQTEFCDVFRVKREEDKQSIGIEDVRLFIKNLSLSPQRSPVVVGIIEKSQTLTPEAQHALLKTLEEPPPKARIIIEAEYGSSLLPTIVSRCQIIHLLSRESVSPEEKQNVLTTFSALQGKKPGEIVLLVTRLFENREEGIHFLDILLRIFHQRLSVATADEPILEPFFQSSKRLTLGIRTILYAQQLLASHVQTALIFDHFFLTIMLDKQ